MATEDAVRTLQGRLHDSQREAGEAAKHASDTQNQWAAACAALAAAQRQLEDERRAHAAASAPPTAARPLLQCKQCTACGVTGRVKKCLRYGRANRGTVGVAGEHELTARGEDCEIARRPRRLRPGRSEGTDGDRDEGGILPSQFGEIDGHCARLEQHVASANQVPEQGATRGRGDIDGDAATRLSTAQN